MRTRSLWPTTLKRTTVPCLSSGRFIRSSNKKRPNSLVFGRTYERQILDIFELNIQSFTGDIENTFKQFDANTLPVFICSGDIFETNSQLGRMRNFFSDFFSPFRNEKVYLNTDFSLQLIVTLSGFEDKSFVFKFYRASKRSNELDDLGIMMKATLGRVEVAEEDRFKEACKKVQLKKKKKTDKTTEVNTLGETMGRVFVRQQDLKTLRLKKIKKRTGRKEE